MTSATIAANDPGEPLSDHDDGSEKTVALQDQEQSEGQTSKVADVPPDGGYGWVCVAAVFMVNAHTWGLNSVSLIITMGIEYR